MPVNLQKMVVHSRNTHIPINIFSFWFLVRVNAYISKSVIILLYITWMSVYEIFCLKNGEGFSSWNIDMLQWITKTSSSAAQQQTEVMSLSLASFSCHSVLQQQPTKVAITLFSPVSFYKYIYYTNFCWLSSHKVSFKLVREWWCWWKTK